MARIAAIVFILLSFSVTLFADDSCCYEESEQRLSLHADTCDQGETDKERTDDCRTCYRCGNGLNFAVKIGISIMPRSESVFDYLPSIAPTPDLLGFLRPPIV